MMNIKILQITKIIKIKITKESIKLIQIKIFKILIYKKNKALLISIIITTIIIVLWIALCYKVAILMSRKESENNKKFRLKELKDKKK